MSGTRLRDRTDDDPVTCIACGDTVSREDAREYDKYGDRYSRDGKQFEYHCKPCDRECSHAPRDGLESTLVDIDAGEVSRETFLARYARAVSPDGESSSE